MAKYKVTACWYETVEVEAGDEYEAIDAAYTELRSEIRQNGPVDDFEIEDHRRTLVTLVVS